LKFQESNSNEFDFYSSNQNLENIIIESIKFILLILYENYSGYKNIILYHNKYKTLFRNLYEILKVNSNNANIMNGISKELYTLFFEFKNELNKFRNEFFKNADEKSFLENEKIILNFSDGLIEMIFDSQLYLNSKDKNNFITLFHLLKKIVQEYMHSNPMNIEFPFQKGFFYNIIHFIKALENLFVNDYNNNNIAIKSYFALLKEYLEAIDNKITRQNYFRNLLIHVFKIYPNNLTIIINFLNFTNEMIWKNYSLESEDIELLFDFYSNKNEEIQKEKEDLENTIINCEDFEDHFNEICEKFKKIIGATGIYISKYDLKRVYPLPEDADENGHIDPANIKVLQYVNWCDDHSFLNKKFLEPGTGVTYKLINPNDEEGEEGEEEKKEEANDDEEENEEKKEEPKEEVLNNIEIEEVVNEPKIHFFREPRLGSYIAIDIRYQSSLQYSSLTSAIENLNEYKVKKEEQDKRLAEKAEEEKENEGKNEEKITKKMKKKKKKTKMKIKKKEEKKKKKMKMTNQLC
jgi:hypothetical protein